MNRVDDNYIAENNLVERYLQNTLTLEEAIEFEEYILDKPEILERLELDSALIEHLPSALEDARNRSNSSKQTGISSLWQTLWSKPLVHSAMSFALGALVIVLINGYSEAPLPYSGRIDLVEVSPLRSSSAKDMPDATYSLNNKADSIMLLLQPGYIESDSVLVKITKQSDNAVVFNEKVAVNSSGDLVVLLKTETLQPGMLEINLADTDVEVEVSQLLISITR